MPSVDDRARIWHRHLDGVASGEPLDVAFLAGAFACSGGDICNAVMVARVLAADEDVPVSMRHLVLGLSREIRKSGRIVDADQFGPWRDDVLATARC